MPATLLPAAAGKKYWLVGDHVTFKILPEHTGEKYSAAVTWVGPGGGPPPHVHGREDELFYVLEGTIGFVSGETHFTGGPGTAVYLKKGIPHAFKNVGATPARFILAAIPCGFEKFVPECGIEIETIPADIQMSPAIIEKLMATAPKYGITMLFTHQASKALENRYEGTGYWVWGNHVQVKLTGAETEGNFCVAETTTPPGAGVPVHKHVAMDEWFYVLEGTMEFTVDGAVHAAEAGTTVILPKGTAHGFRNTTGSPVRMLDVHSPGGFEKFFAEAGVVGDVNHPPAPAPVNKAAVLKLLAKHGMEPG